MVFVNMISRNVAWIFPFLSLFFFYYAARIVSRANIWRVKSKRRAAWCT